MSFSCKRRIPNSTQYCPKKGNFYKRGCAANCSGRFRLPLIKLISFGGKWRWWGRWRWQWRWRCDCIDGDCKGDGDGEGDENEEVETEIAERDKGNIVYLLLLKQGSQQQHQQSREDSNSTSKSGMPATYNSTAGCNTNWEECPIRIFYV